MKIHRVLAFAFAICAASSSFAAESVKWNDWGDDLFSRAAAGSASSSSISKRWVPLVPRHGKDHLCGPRGRRAFGIEISGGRVDQDANRTCRAGTGIGAGRRPSCSVPTAPRSPRSGDYRARADAGAQAVIDDRPRPFRRGGVRNQAVRFCVFDERAARRAHQELR